jgi:DNA-binding winged helix-turn-helix (wHTH) protein
VTTTVRAPNINSIVRFGVFEVDLRAGEVLRLGSKVKLQDQPFQVLVMLLERPGQVVTREELRFHGGPRRSGRRLGAAARSL